MPRYQFLNIEAFHLIIAEAKEVFGSSGSMRGLLSMQPEMSILIALHDPRRRPNLRGSAALS
jgi:hypothetical protein